MVRHYAIRHRFKYAKSLNKVSITTLHSHHYANFSFAYSSILTINNLTGQKSPNILKIWEGLEVAMVDTTFLEERIAAVKARILLWESAITQISTGAMQSFTIDTGQTRKVVTMANITEARNAMDAEYSLLYALEARCYGGSVTARPDF